MIYLFDKILMQDLKDFKLGVNNIYNLQFRYSEIIKVVKNRTQEKLNLLKLFLEYQIINKENYQELNARVEYDYKYAYLYIMGLIQNLE